MAIFTHVVLGTNDLARATRFYDVTLGALGINNMGGLGENAVAYGAEHPEFLVTRPRNGEPACFANGGTIGFVAPNPGAVQEFHEAGLANGGTDEGAPGPRDVLPNAYGAYLRDPDGNKICSYCFTA